MALRNTLAALFVMICGSAAAQTIARPVHPVPARPIQGQVNPVVFYVAKGAPDACGRGCDTWIAIEGQIDGTAAARFRKFLQPLRNRNLPIYVTSPGGNLEQALAMGTFLHEKPAVVRVARTVVRECGFEAQDREVCLKLKRSGRELTGDLWTRNAICNSACPYFLLGATTREIAPDTSLGVHSAKVITQFLGVVPTPEMRAAATERGRARSDGLLASYFARMGGDTGLLKLVSTVKFEEVHVLTRDEIIRFGFDRRVQVETPWQFENGARSLAGKVATQKVDGEPAYRLLQWRLICLSTEQFELDVQRPTTKSVFPTVAIHSAAAVPLYFTPIPIKTPGSEFWGARLTRAAVDELASQPQFEFIEASQIADGRHAVNTVWSTEGLSQAVDTLLSTCPPPKTTTAVMRDAAEK
ncbi:MAG: hypothetical protein ABSG88_19735 [Bradyrhizobium sp.]